MKRPLSRFSRFGLSLGLPVLLLLGLCLGAQTIHAQPPGPSRDGFRWVDSLDDATWRERGGLLSRPLPTVESADIPLPDPPLAVDFLHYPTAAEMSTFLAQLEEAYPDLVHVSQVGRSWQGQPILAATIGNRATGDPDSRPALYVQGLPHAREAISAQVSLYLAWYLAAKYGQDPLVTHLLDTRTVYIVPCTNPDGNDIFLSSDQRQRKNANPIAGDDDGDGVLDEDGREGAGYGTYELYHYEFDAAWVELHPDDPFSEGWENHSVRRAFLGLFDREGREIEQIDNDGDGQFGEDPPGGVDPNRNFDSHWELGDNDPRLDTYRGPAAFSEPETQAVRDFVSAHANIFTALDYQSGTDTLLHPWAWSSDAELADAFWYEMLSRKGSQLTEANGFEGTAHGWTARGLYSGAGSALDWFCERGIVSWAPEVYGASTLSFAERITTTNAYTVGLSTGESFNPLAQDIPRTVNRWLGWNLYLLAATPHVSLSGLGIADGVLTIQVANDGLLPLDVQAELSTAAGTDSTLLSHLSAEQRTWRVPLFQTTGQPITLTLRGTRTGSNPGEPAQEQAFRLRMEGNSVLLEEGNLEPFTDWAGFFQGWYAERRWDGEDYHLGPALLAECFLPFSAKGARAP